MKKKIISAYQQLILPDWSVPLILFGLSFVTFGFFAPKMGFYMDDWHFVHYAYTRGVDSLNEVLFYDSRPYAGWLYILGFRLLGYKPIVWHITVLILRSATATFFWLFFRSLWGNKPKEGIYLSLLFLVYPFFLLQPMTVAYFIHWVGFFLYALSLWLMLLAIQQKKNFAFLIIGIALTAEGLHLFTSEYFSGLEILRPFILWIFISRKENTFFHKIKETFFHWLPYLFVFSVYAYWRGVLFQGAAGLDRNAPVLFSQLLEAPIHTIFQLLILALKDSVFILFKSWESAFAPEVFNLTSYFARFVLLAIILGFLSLSILLNKLKYPEQKDENKKQAKKWRVEATLLGFIALFSGTFPIWVIGKAISTHKNQMAATRFGLPSMFGAALLFVVLIEYFISNRKKANIAVALLVSLAMGIHFNNSHQYKYSWEKQVDFYQQFTQRVPDMEPNTAIISLGEFLWFMGEYPTSYVMNTVYPSQPDETPYWFFTIYSSFYDQIDNFMNGMPIEEKHLLSNFSGNSAESLYISFEPGLNQCLWILRPEDANLRLISQLEQRASLNSAIDRIQIDGENIRVLPPEIFGDEMPQNWCSYYQKADLARQRENWDEVVNLWEEAKSKDKRPENGFEYIPFIEAYAYNGDWGQSKILTRHAKKVSKGMEPILCSTLFRLEEKTEETVPREEVLTNLFEYLGCQE